MDNDKIKKSITVEFWCAIFKVLSYISIFKLVKRIAVKVCEKTESEINLYNFVDIWVLLNLLLSCIAIPIVWKTDIYVLRLAIVLYGLLRVFEIVVYQVNVLLFDEYRAAKDNKPYAIRGARRIIVNVLCNFIEIVFWFTASYCFLYGAHLAVDQAPTLIQLFLTSFSYTTGFGIHDLLSLPKTSDLGALVLYFQSIAGMFISIVTLARFISLLPKTKSLDEYEDV